MATKLLTFKLSDAPNARDLSHAALIEVQKNHPAAECRENPNTGEFYVYDGPGDRANELQTAPPPKSVLADLPPGLVDAIAAAVVEKLTKK